MKEVKKEKEVKKGKEKVKKLKELLEFNKIIHPVFKSPRTAGQRAADWITKWAGSWGFIISFLLFFGIWIYINVHLLVKIQTGQPWDPYPFILLNLILSCLAAIQAPIILMSQNRENQRDRLRVQYDYAVNRKAEKEIREIKRLLLLSMKKKK